MGLVLLGDPDLEEAVELGAVGAAAGCLPDERLDVGEAEDRARGWSGAPASCVPWRSQSPMRYDSSRWTGCGVTAA